MEVILSKNATKEFEHLNKTEQIKVHKKLIALGKNPLGGKKLSGELLGTRSLRVWPFRILYEINVKSHRIEVHSIVHRQSAYK